MAQGEPAWASDDIALRTDADLTVRRARPRTRRALGALLMALGVPGGVFVSIGAPIAESLSGDGYSTAVKPETKAAVVLGAVLAVTAFIGGIALLTGHHEARFEQTEG